MSTHRFAYWAHTNKSEPSRVFKRKRDALEWGRLTYSGVFIVEPIIITKLSQRLEYIRTALGYHVTTA